MLRLTARHELLLDHWLSSIPKRGGISQIRTTAWLMRHELHHIPPPAFAHVFCSHWLHYVALKCTKTGCHEMRTLCAGALHLPDAPCGPCGVHPPPSAQLSKVQTIATRRSPWAAFASHPVGRPVGGVWRKSWPSETCSTSSP